jgi:hypothetical protein
MMKSVSGIVHCCDEPYLTKKSQHSYSWQPYHFSLIKSCASFGSSSRKHVQCEIMSLALVSSSNISEGTCVMQNWLLERLVVVPKNMWNLEWIRLVNYFNCLCENEGRQTLNTPHKFAGVSTAPCARFCACLFRMMKTCAA